MPTDLKMPPRTLARQLGSFTFVTILGFCATGCTWIDDFFDESVTLTDFAPVAAQVSVELSDTPRSQLVLEPKDGLCPTMRDDIEATVDDKPMDVFIRGGQQPSGKSWICGMPTFRRNVAQADIGETSTKFVVEDDTATFKVVANGLLLERNITSTKGMAPMEAGVESSFDWSVPTDVVDPALVKADYFYDDPSLVVTAEISVRVEGSVLFIRLPTDAPAGKGTLMLEATANVPVETCEGVPACTATAHVFPQLAIDVLAMTPPNP